LEGRFFNIGFIVDPDGNVSLQHYKISALLPVERSVSPHDPYDGGSRNTAARSTPSGRSPTPRSAGSAS
jgi:hypothetical protein